MPGTVVVPDASVLLKWALRSHDEPGRDRALALRTAWIEGACELVVPSLWPFEVGNVLGLKAPATSGALLQAMYDLGMAEESPHRDVVAILSLMREFEVTFYAAEIGRASCRERVLQVV